jgi:hypothetical protein
MEKVKWHGKSFKKKKTKKKKIIDYRFGVPDTKLKNKRKKCKK